MSVTAWRVVPRLYSESPYNPFDGEGARLFGGRWNSPGIPVVYTSNTLSLAVLETLVHVDDRAALLDRVVFAVEIPPELITSVDPADLPRNWSDPLAPPSGLRAIGDDWVTRARSPVLRVPSAVVTIEFNYVLNPRHPDFAKLIIGERQLLPIDPRLFKK